ncbi:FecR domain-containing protein [Sorangium sp. So ce1000]|uniref:FecR domain-containing protein n=1 Tax=Sorangium sp. So ce1000 TaxID=3133325 RepID=UPI003F5FADF2
MKQDDVDTTPEDRAAAAGVDGVEASLRGLVEQPVPPLPRVQARYLQQRIAGRIDQLAAEAAERRARGARRKRAALAAAALAAALTAAAAGVLIVVRARDAPPAAAQVTALQGSVEIAAEGATRSPPSLALVPLASDEELRTGEGARAKASLATGATVEVGPSTRVRFAPVGAGRDRAGDIVALEQGTIAVEVPRLPAGMSLSVRTSDAVVTVHGTRFSVERRPDAAGEPAETRVSVVEGRVAVRRGEVERFLSPGETWSSRDDERRADRPPEGRPGDAPAPPREAGQDSADGEGGRRDGAGEGGAGEPRAPRDAREAPPRTSLTAENELLQSAMAARRRGQPRRAIERLDLLLRRYPDSPLAEIARVERLRAIEALGDKERTAAEARRYLRDYPQGFGREEATSASRPGGARP